jgi:uncharacterized protein (TIGR02266 family)
MAEKRKYNRVSKKCKSVVESMEGVTFSTAHDISEGGIFISTPEPVHPGSTVDIEVYLSPEETITLKGTVRWIRKHEEGDKKAGMGIQFIPTSKEIDKLKKLLK